MIIDHDIAGRLNLKDPTKTAAIRKKWISQFRKRFRKLKGRINRFLLDSDKSLAINSVYQFDSDPEKVKEFLAWLQQQIDLIIFDNVTNPNLMWQNVYISQAYEKGVQKAKQEIQRQAEVTALLLLLRFDSTVSEMTQPFSQGFNFINQPIYSDVARMSYSKNFSALQGVTGELQKQISRILFDGMQTEKSTTEIAKLINDRVDKIGLSRSKLIANTETVLAFNLAKITETELMAKKINVPAKVEWITKGDERVRTSHAYRNRKIYSTKRARTLLGEPNCRCKVVPYFKKLDSPEARRERSQARKQGLKLVL